MKAIIIEENSFKQFTDKMELFAKSAEEGIFHRKPQCMTDDEWRNWFRELHRRFHYEFVQWAQGHGASCN